MNSRIVLVFGLLAMMVLAWVAAWVIWQAAEIGEQIAPLAPREWSGLTLVTVGTGSERENPTRLGPVSAVAWQQNVVLVDAGRGVTEALRGAGIPVTQPTRVLLTNLLPENTLGLDDLLYTGWLQDREEPLQVIGPRGTRALVEGLRAAYAQGERALGNALPLPAAGGRIDVVEADDGFSLEVDGVTMRAAAIRGGPLPALAWRFDRGRRSIVVSGTGWAGDGLVALARSADLLVHDAVYVPPDESIEEAGVLVDPERLEAERAIHTSIEEIGAMATEAGVEGLVLVRLRPPPLFESQISTVVAATFEGDIYVPEDGHEIVP